MFAWPALARGGLDSSKLLSGTRIGALPPVQSVEARRS
jgi:hypothetical protein